MTPSASGSDDRPSKTTVLLRQMSGGDPRAAALLFDHLYEELRTHAQIVRRRVSRECTVETADLVNSVYVRLCGKELDLELRAQFFALAAKVMSRLILDWARDRVRRDKRHRLVGMLGDQPGVAEVGAAGVESIDIVSLLDALRRLEEVDDRAASLVYLHRLLDMPMSDAASHLGISLATAKRDWTYARSWLARDLGGDCDGE